MTVEVLPTRGREMIAELLSQLSFLFVLSSGDPAWDSQWDGQNPPTVPLESTDVLNAFGFARPTVKGFVTPDAAGSIIADNGARYAVSAERTRFLRVRMSIPAGSYVDRTVREIGLFANPEISPDVLAGQTIIEPADVIDRGDLLLLSRFRPQFMSAGTSLARNCIVRI